MCVILDFDHQYIYIFYFRFGVRLNNNVLKIEILSFAYRRQLRKNTAKQKAAFECQGSGWRGHFATCAHTYRLKT